MKKEILIVDELCFPMLGGQQVHLQSLAEGLVRMGNNVSIVAIDHVGNLLNEQYVNGVHLNRILHDSNYYKGGRFGRKISTIFKYTILLRPYFNKKYDYIIFNQFPILPIIIYKLFYKNRSKTVLDFVEFRSNLFWRIIQYFLFHSADIVICISKNVEKRVLKVKAKDIFSVPSFVEVKLSKSLSKDFYLFIGRFEEHKHPEDAIKAVLAFNQRYNQIRELHLIGDGALYEPLKEKYSYEKKIIFHGRTSDEEKKQILSNGRILILPSEREGLPIVIIEAMSYGIPTITTEYTDNGAQYFVKEHQTGLVAKPSIDDIVNQIHNVELKYSFFQEKCNKEKWKYDSDYCCEKYFLLLEKIQK